jgi:alkylhydroperoxidase/carboxymuconolactone decarboxylase family protein YurZ
MSESERERGFTFRWEAPVHEVFPSLHEAQSAWLAQIDSLSAPDRKTHELIRMVCTVIARNAEGTTRHARLAREMGATWDDVMGSIMLTAPAFGILAAVEMLPHAREGFDSAPEAELDDDGNGG